MNYAIFCYREDHQCLGLCLEQIRSIDRAAQFYLFDDAAKPLFPAQVPAGNDISYKITYFARRGNLNGLECVRGMLGCMLDIPGDDPVIKIDADTLLMDPAEIIRSLKDRGKVAGGMQCSVPLAWAGCCYWLTRPAIKAALELLARRECRKTPVRNIRKMKPFQKFCYTCTGPPGWTCWNSGAGGV